ncbi:MAG: hypothetical protein DHS20C21_00570 [Gemmatimonadota bacterium]|nr:MAG: hypothetical protein DHS20C21_00570 [Gemmatimonadota bacterium]
MNHHARMDMEAFEGSSITNRRLLRQEELILDVTEQLVEAMEEVGVSRTELAQRLGKSKGFVSQVLSGNQNVTLRTLANFSDALDRRVIFQLRPSHPAMRVCVLGAHPPAFMWNATDHRCAVDFVIAQSPFPEHVFTTPWAMMTDERQMGIAV